MSMQRSGRHRRARGNCRPFRTRNRSTASRGGLEADHVRGQRTRITRRRHHMFIKQVIAIAAGLLSAVAMTAQAQDTGPIRIGLIYSKQGPGASIGEFLERGSELAVEQA